MVLAIGGVGIRTIFQAIGVCAVCETAEMFIFKQ